MLFVCGVELYVAVYVVNVSGYGVWADFCCIEYDQEIEICNIRHFESESSHRTFPITFGASPQRDR